MITVKCNQCEKDISEAFDHGNCLDVTHTFGYDSDLDMARVRFHLCESCLQQIIKRFKIPATMHDPYARFGDT